MPNDADAVISQPLDASLDLFVASRTIDKAIRGKAEVRTARQHGYLNLVESVAQAMHICGEIPFPNDHLRLNTPKEKDTRYLIRKEWLIVILNLAIVLALVTRCGYLASPVMRVRARLHRHHAGRQTAKKAQHLRTP